MLRLVKTGDVGEDVEILVEGRVVSPWLELLEAECRRELGNERQVTLDLSGLAYVGPNGIRLIRDLTCDGVKLIHVPGLIDQMLGPCP